MTKSNVSILNIIFGKLYIPYNLQISIIYKKCMLSIIIFLFILMSFWCCLDLVLVTDTVTDVVVHLVVHQSDVEVDHVAHPDHLGETDAVEGRLEE